MLDSKNQKEELGQLFANNSQHDVEVAECECGTLSVSAGVDVVFIAKEDAPFLKVTNDLYYHNCNYCVNSEREDEEEEEDEED